MKMKLSVAAIAAALFLCVFGLAGCASNQVQPLQPAQIAAVACPQLNLVHSQLVALNTALQADPKTADLGKKAAAQLAAVQPAVAAVCNGATAAPKVDFSNIQALAQTGLPALAALVASLPIPPAQQAQAQAALAVAGTAVGIISALQQPASPAPASSTK